MTTVFVSYSWDSESHKKRIKRFVEYLRRHQIKVIFDGDARLGELLPDFMEKGVSASDYVLMCYTPTYKRKADGRLKKEISGVAYENTMITGEVYRRNNQYKFIPILFEGTWETSTPYWAIGKLGIDLRGNNAKAEMGKLMETLNGQMPDDLFPDSLQMPSVDKAKKIKSFFLISIPVIAAIATIVVALFGDNIIGRLTTEAESVPDNTYSSELDSFGDYVESDIDLSINELFNKLWEDSNYIRSEYVKNLINTGITRYNNGDFSYAGALFEQAIKEGDEGVTARNNLSFMIRRHEYISENYELDNLLEQCRESGGAFSLINYAMYLVSINEWGDADSQFKRIRYSDPEIEQSINWWKRLYDQGDCEGSLVLGWLLKYGFYEDDKRLVSDYFWDAKKYYEDMPNFLYSASNSDQKYDIKYKLFEAEFLSLNKTSNIGMTLKDTNIVKSYLKNLHTGHVYDDYFFEDNYSAVSEGFIPLYHYAVNFMGIDEGEYELYIEVQDYEPYLARVLVNEYNENDIILLQPKDKDFDYCFSLEVRNKNDGSFVERGYRVDIGDSFMFASYETSYEHTNIWVEYGTKVSVTCGEETQTETITQKDQLIEMYF